MKKFIIFILLSLNIMAVEIIPEDFLMQKTLVPLSKSKIYTMGDKKVYALRITPEVLKSLETTENPFYIYDSNHIRTLVHLGDYFISPLTLASVSVMKEKDFQDNFNIDTPTENVIIEDIKKENVDESYGEYNE